LRFALRVGPHPQLPPPLSALVAVRSGADPPPPAVRPPADSAARGAEGAGCSRFFPMAGSRAYRCRAVDQRARTAAHRRLALAGAATAWRAEHDAQVRALARRRLLIAGSLFLGLHLAGFAVFRPAAASRAELVLRAVIVPLTLVVMGVAWRDRAARWA